MGLKKNITKQQEREFYDRIIYPVQFKGSVPKLVFHVYNVFYIITGGDSNLIKRVVKVYLPDTAEYIIDKHLQTVADKYQAEKSSNIIRPDCFTCIKEELVDEDMYFEHSSTHRKVILAEYKFILQRATSRVRQKGGSSTLSNNYFMKSGLEVEYRKYTGKALSPNKLSYIMQVLAKYNYLHVTYNNNGSRVVQIGSNNPFYVLHDIPEVDKQAVTTKTDRTITHLAEQVKMLQSALDSLKEELEQAKAENATLQQGKELLENPIIERDGQLEQLKGRLIGGSVKRQNVLSRIDSYIN